jgi:hypothetical protein
MKNAGIEYRKEIETGLTEVNLYNSSAGWINLNGIFQLHAIVNTSMNLIDEHRCRIVGR